MDVVVSEPSSVVREKSGTSVALAKTLASVEESLEDDRVPSAEDHSSEEVRQNNREASTANTQGKASPESASVGSFEKDPKITADANLRESVNKLSSQLVVESQNI